MYLSAQMSKAVKRGSIRNDEGQMRQKLDDLRELEDHNKKTRTRDNKAKEN